MSFLTWKNINYILHLEIRCKLEITQLMQELNKKSPLIKCISSIGGISQIIVSFLIIISSSIHNNTRCYEITCIHNAGSVLKSKSIICIFNFNLPLLVLDE